MLYVCQFWMVSTHACSIFAMILSISVPDLVDASAAAAAAAASSRRCAMPLKLWPDSAPLIVSECLVADAPECRCDV